MTSLRDRLRDCRGSAAVEMALVTPLLLALLFGSVELGNYFYDEHKLVKSVRDSARYAARQQFSNYSSCTGAPSDPVPSNAELMARTGTLDSTAADLLPNWSSGTFSISMTCVTSLVDGSGGTYNLGGIYANVSAPTVLVTVSLPYRSILGTALGFSSFGLTLNATQSAAVVGL
jgi:Flp pilus assembly protein TadG